MNRSFIVVAGVTSIALALVLSTQISASAKISAPTNPKQPHRLAVQVDVNDPAVMNLALHSASDVVQRYHEIGEKVEIEVAALDPDRTCCEMTPLSSKCASSP
jgi:hypothetical protein